MPVELDAILSEFDDDAEAWVLQDQDSMKYVIIPDSKNPTRKPVRFFMKCEDAKSIFEEIKKENPYLKNKNIMPIKVKLKPSLKSIAMDKNPENADSFVVHGPNEVYEFIRDRKI
jgi:hypothetical protein